MNKDLIINSSPEGVEIALLEEKKLVEIHNEKLDARWSVGDLYLGKVKKIIPGLNAAFVDVGFEKDAFLHYTDLSPYIKSIIKYTQQATADENNQFDFSKFQSAPEIIKTGKISEVLNGKPHILVQILAFFIIKFAFFIINFAFFIIKFAFFIIKFRSFFFVSILY